MIYALFTYKETSPSGETLATGVIQPSDLQKLPLISQGRVQAANNQAHAEAQYIVTQVGRILHIAQQLHIVWDKQEASFMSYYEDTDPATGTTTSIYMDLRCKPSTKQLVKAFLQREMDKKLQNTTQKSSQENENA